VVPDPKDTFVTRIAGGVIVTPDFLDQLALNGKTSLISTVTAIYDIGCFFGAISVCVIGDPLGRKKCVLLGTTIMSIGAIIQIASFGVPEMIVGRIIAGIGNGINTSTGQYSLGNAKIQSDGHSARLARRDVEG
jgi:MFS family permease